jgi:hypothetical protein
MDEPIFVVTIKPGVYLERDAGVSKGALVLANKECDGFTDIVLCYAEASQHHPFVVWSYEHSSGLCRRGDYFTNLEEALNRYKERNY